MERTDQEWLDLIVRKQEDIEESARLSRQTEESLRQSLHERDARIVELAVQVDDRDAQLRLFAVREDDWTSELEDALRLLPPEQRFTRECVSCNRPDTLQPRISADGSAWEGWTCSACGRKEWFTVPLPGGWIRTVMEDLRDE